MKVTGQENLLPPGPVLFASNHQSYYDPMLVAAHQALPMRYMAWDALFHPAWFGGFIYSGGAFPVDTDGKDPGGFRTAVDVLKEGHRVLIFPEGERSYDGRLVPLREGTARLAMHAKVAITPVCISGASQAWPRGDFSPKPFIPISIHFAPAIHPRPVKPGEERRRESARIMEELRLAIQPKLEALI